MTKQFAIITLALLLGPILFSGNIANAQNGMEPLSSCTSRDNGTRQAVKKVVSSSVEDSQVGTKNEGGSI